MNDPMFETRGDKTAFLRSGGDEYNIDKFIGRFI